MINFYTVTLINNKNCIEKCLINLRKLYKNKFHYTIICPSESCKLFSDLACGKNIKVVDEDTIIPFSSFKKLAYEISNIISKTKNIKIKINENRLGWYYQQVLKLSFLLEESKNKRTTMIDADTILINKMPFYSGTKSNLFATDYEKNKYYWETLNTIFGSEIPFKKWISTTCQINSLTPLENKFLINKLEEYIPYDKSLTKAEWISKIIITAVVSTHKKIDSSYFGEQDFIGYFLRLEFGTLPRKILFLREKVNFKLTRAQEKISSYLGFKHITYESWLIKDKNKKLPWINFIYLILFSFLVPILRKLKQLIQK